MFMTLSRGYGSWRMGHFSDSLFPFFVFSVSASHDRLECGPDAFRSIFCDSE